MLETEIHDLSDDSDYAASQIHESGIVTRRDSSDTISSPSNPDDQETEVVFSKDNVAIHPTQFASDRIGGRLRLIKQGKVLLMAWTPYKGQNLDVGLPEKDMSLYAIKAISFSDVHSIRRHTPALGWQYIIVVMSSGLAYPPLYFYTGGVKEFLATIKRHVFLMRSSDDANVFLVNDLRNPLQRTLSSLEIPMAVSLSNGTTAATSGETSLSNESQIITDGNNTGDFASLSLQNSRLRPKVHDPARDLSIQVLEKFSLVTRFARETTSQLFREGNGFAGHERKHNIPYPQGYYSDDDSHDDEKTPDEKVSVAPDPMEFDKVSLVWGKPRQQPLVSDEWGTFLDFEGRVVDPDALRKRIFYGGVDHDLRREVWPFLLEHFSFDSTYAEREYLKHVKKSEYEAIKLQWQSISPEQARRFAKFRERKGLIDKDVVYGIYLKLYFIDSRQSVSFCNILVVDFLVCPAKVRTDGSISFYEGDDNPNVILLRDVLLTYSFYNFDLGYCQGMSDILSPILYIIGDESETFWCFVSLMERLGPNFNRDQNGMHSQLFALGKMVELLDHPLHNYFKQQDCLNYFFCFRWILIQFKREFDFHQLMRLWEVFWTHYPSEHLHLYACVSILKRYRHKIMGEQMDFDTLLKFINELSGHINIDSVLRDAEALCICAGESGTASIPPGTPPSLPLEGSLLYPQQDDVL